MGIMISLQKYFSEASFWVPDRFAKSGWIEHAPFAFWLIDAFRPQTIVELGTHNGYSFLCFCQAIKTLNYPAKAYAVDTWQGDEHAGFYGDDVYQKLSSYHSARYGEFSELVRSTFDSAHARFKDGSVDLLHIDGRHLYEDVRHDFELWRSKLSPRAIVLFHDTNAHENEFGVHRFWKEMEVDFPNFNFLHGHGLGVLGYGKAEPPKLKPLFDAKNQVGTAEVIRLGYGRLGSGLMALQLEGELRERETDIARLLDGLETRRFQVEEFEAARRLQVEEIAGLRDGLETRRLQFEELEAARRLQVEELETAQRLQLLNSKNTIADLSAQVLSVTADLRRAQSWKGVSRTIIVMPVRIVQQLYRKCITWVRRKDAAIIANSGIFDRDWYSATYPDVAASGLEPLTHYLTVGSASGYNPSCLFDTAWYLGRYPEAAKAGIAPLIHYLTFGAAKRYSPHPLFDADWYLTKYPDVANAGIEPLKHYLVLGAREFRNPNPFFDTKWYLQTYSDVYESQINPLAHYATRGWLEGRNTHPQYSLTKYKSRFPSIDFAQIDPLRHAFEHLLPDEITRLTGEKGRYLSDILFDVSGPGEKERVIELFATIERFKFYLSNDTARINSPLKEPMRFRNIEADIHSLSLTSKKLNDARPIQVSIVIPVHNQLPYTIACIQSLLTQVTRYRFEILVGDDRSGDKTAALLAEIAGVVRVQTHERNLGFIGNCNATAKGALGQYLVFLNNDTFVLAGWLGGLIEPFERFPNTGLVGSRILSADGTLQEAGGIVWSDGSAWNYGRASDPRLPEFNYLKNVDYCSGCSLAIPKYLWNELGGFDEEFSPAYYEDVDLAFSLRERGYRTIYNPDSILIHHEGVSHGVDISIGLKAYQVENQKKFLKKWQAILSSEHFPRGQEVLVARDRSARRPHILVVDHYIPKFDRDTGSRTMFEYLKLFIDLGFHVVFWPQDLWYDPTYVRAAQALGVEVIYGAQYLNNFTDWLDKNSSRLSYAFLTRPNVAESFIDDLRRTSHIKILYFGVDIHFLRMKQEQQFNDSDAIHEDIITWENRERRIWSLVDVIYHPADYEVEFVQHECPDKVSRLLPLFMFAPETIEDARKWAEAGHQGRLPVVVFVGGFSHSPNVDAAVWLVREIWPYVIARIPDAVLYIAGSTPTAEVLTLAAPNIHVTGFISDPMLTALYQASQVAVVPLRYGGGVKGKIIESLRFGVPVVTTTIGVQGIPGATAFISVADLAADIADAIVRLIADPATARSKARAGVDFIAKEYSRDRVRRLLALDIPEIGEPDAYTKSLKS